MWLQLCRWRADRVACHAASRITASLLAAFNVPATPHRIGDRFSSVAQCVQNAGATQQRAWIGQRNAVRAMHAIYSLNTKSFQAAYSRTV